jgi:catechol 2,3-dioxygenase-like lactoylglutathione lyase family enzyme
VQIGSKDSTKSSPRRKRLGFRIKIKAIKVVVQNLERSRWFYQDILGLKIARESKTLVNFGELLTLVSHDHGADVESPNKQNPQTHAILCLECSDIQSCHDRLRALVEVKVTPIRDWSGRKAFRCVDMDGNVLEIFESLPEKQQIFDQKP